MSSKNLTISEMFDAEQIIDDAVTAASFEMVVQHKRSGQPIVVWRDGKVVHVPAEEVLAELDRLRAQQPSPKTPAA